jgi:prevent-host-death family protein
MKSATIADAKAHLSALIADIEAGEEVVITRRGKPVARLIAEPESRTFDWSDLDAWVKEAPASPGPTVADLRDQDLL